MYVCVVAMVLSYHAGAGHLCAKGSGNIFGSQVIYQLRQVRQESSIEEFGTSEIDR